MLNGRPTRVSDTKTKKPVLVLLHGYLETLEVWESFLPFIENDYRVISIDLPGHGMSVGLENDFQIKDPVNSLELAAETIKAYLDMTNLQTVFIGGHSMGGYVAQCFAKLFPERVNGLILFHSSPYSDSDKKKMDREREISLIQQQKLEILVDLSIPLIFNPEHFTQFRDVADALIGYASMHSPDGICACLRGMRDRASFETFLSKTPIPTLCFFGLHDVHMPVERAQQIAQLSPRIQTVFLEQSGHAGFLEEPEIVASSLTRFISSLIQ